jgi:hypothetical protein
VIRHGADDIQRQDPPFEKASQRTESQGRSAAEGHCCIEEWIDLKAKIKKVRQKSLKPGCGKIK